MSPSLSKREVNRQRWYERIKAWENSSQSQREFCKDHHLGYASFRRWRQILKAEDSEELITPTDPVRFLAVKVQAEKPANLTILIQDDLRVEVPSGFNPQVLQQVIQVLRTA